MSLKHDHRFVAIKTALGADGLALRSVSVQEQISRLLQIEADLSREDGKVDFDKVAPTRRLTVALW
jgi:uncharacterized protein involved in type VI secretion and phage assembly